MQILHVYRNHARTMTELDYLNNSLVHYLSDSTLWLDNIPIIPRTPECQVKPNR